MFEQQKETVTVSALMSQVTPLKANRTTFVSVIFRQFDKCFGFFDIAG